MCIRDRIYEEQDIQGARRDIALARALVNAGVPTPEPLRTTEGDDVALHHDKAVALVPWIEGTMRCQ